MPFDSLQRPIIRGLALCCLGRFPSSELVLSSSGLDLVFDFSSYRDVEQARLTAVHSLLFLTSHHIVILKAFSCWQLCTGLSILDETSIPYDLLDQILRTAFTLVLARPLKFSGRQAYYTSEGR